jgi:pSer/pThr/pTyr-binding forkhead associated (FHA) protein
MVSAEELLKNREASHTSLGTFSSRIITSGNTTLGSDNSMVTTAGSYQRLPVLTLYNGNLDIRIVGQNGAVIGRRHGPYSQFFQDNMYISGVHAQLVYNKESGWCIIDKHSSNGTRLNDRELLPDVPMSLKSGDMVTLANVSMQVNIE